MKVTVIVCVLLAAAPAHAHDWYTGLIGLLAMDRKEGQGRLRPDVLARPLGRRASGSSLGGDRGVSTRRPYGAARLRQPVVRQAGASLPRNPARQHRGCEGQRKALGQTWKANGHALLQRPRTDREHYWLQCQGLPILPRLPSRKSSGFPGQQKKKPAEPRGQAG